MTEQIRQGDIPGVQLSYRHPLAATPEEVWRHLTEPERQARWLAEQVTPESNPPGSLVLELTDAAGDVRREGLVPVASEPPHTWVVDLQHLDGSWPVPTRLEFQLTATADGTEISVLQTGFAHLPLSDCLTIWETYRRRWRTCFAALARSLG